MLFNKTQVILLERWNKFAFFVGDRILRKMISLQFDTLTVQFRYSDHFHVTIFDVCVDMLPFLVLLSSR